MSPERYTWINTKLHEKESTLGGLGTFAQEQINKDELLMVFGGYIMSFSEEAVLPKEAQDLAIQIERGFVIGRKTPASLKTGDYVNHSCSPNAGIRGQISLYAMRTIELGEEITFDYGTVLYTPEGTEVYSLTCACNQINCRGTITSNDWMNEAISKFNRRYLPFYLLDAIEQREAKLKN